MADIITDTIYPHILQVKNGDVWESISKCEDQPNSGGKTTTIADRTDYVYASLVFIPLSNVTVKPGKEIRVLGTNNEQRLTGTALRFSKDELNIRLWV